MPFSPQPSAPFPFGAAQQGNLCSFTGRGRALSPGQDEGGDNQSLTHSATADPPGRTHPNTTSTGPRGWCWELFLLPAEITGRKHLRRGKERSWQSSSAVTVSNRALARAKHSREESQMVPKPALVTPKHTQPSCSGAGRPCHAAPAGRCSFQGRTPSLMEGQGATGAGWSCAYQSHTALGTTTQSPPEF